MSRVPELVKALQELQYDRYVKVRDETIRLAADEGVSGRRIAALVGMSTSQVSRIIRGVTQAKGE